MVSYDDKTGKFTVEAHDLANDKVTAEEFDHVIVARAISRCPTCPSFRASSNFNGRVLHAHDFRDALEFKGKDILIIGRSYSAEDVGSQCYKYGAKSITSSYRSKPMGFKWPSNWEEKPLLQRVENKTAYFKDGTSKDVDAIILCTGYLHHFPFIEDRAAPEDGQPHVAARPLQGRGVGGQSEAPLHRHAGPVLYLQHVRRPGLVFARRHPRPPFRCPARPRCRSTAPPGAPARRRWPMPSR
jgi:hypothetical protein